MEEGLLQLKEMFLKSVNKTFSPVSPPVSGSSNVATSKTPSFRRTQPLPAPCLTVNLLLVWIQLEVTLDCYFYFLPDFYQLPNSDRVVVSYQRL